MRKIWICAIHAWPFTIMRKVAMDTALYTLRNKVYEYVGQYLRKVWIKQTTFCFILKSRFNFIL